jgi:hypothetical protein
MASPRHLFCSLLLIAVSASCQESHDHGVPERLGSVSFPVSCAPAVQPEFNRGVALLHSFAYSAAAASFHKVAEQDTSCAMAHWGIAMTYFHQLWDPHLTPASTALGAKEIALAQQAGTHSSEEKQYIEALALVFENADAVPYSTRALQYEYAMKALAADSESSVEAHVFYALALISNASPADKTHANQKQALAILEPLWRLYPDHPGIPHYLIHACDSAELAQRGLPAARAYALIAPSAPHALHMPSHIFTQLGLWDDSIASNLAAKHAAHEQGDMGEELHAMDYLVYAYLQLGRDEDAKLVIEQLRSMPLLSQSDFKTSYAATAMPVRYAIERRQFAEAEAVVSPEGAPPQVTAIAIWARGIAHARGEHKSDSGSEIDQLGQLQDRLHASGMEYWSSQTGILKSEVMAWSAQANGQAAEAERLLRESANEEDAVEKLPVTPGPIVPAREQLGELLLEQHRPLDAAAEFKTTLARTPGRRGAIQGLALANQLAAKDRK